MTPTERRRLVEGRLAVENPEALFMDGLDSAILGIVRRNGPPLVCYSEARILTSLMREGMTEEDAMAFYTFNIAGAWMGEHTPAILEWAADLE